MVRKMGPLSKIFGMLPGMGDFKDQIDNIDEREVDRLEAIIHSMTPAERDDPKIIDGSRRARIAKGAGVQVSDVNGLVNRFFEARKMMSSLAGGKMPGMPGLPGSAQARPPAKPAAKKKGHKVSGNPAKRQPRPTPARRSTPGPRSAPTRRWTRRRCRRPWRTSSCRPTCATGSGVNTPLRVAAVVLPEGERRDLYVVDGHVTYEPVRDAEPVPGAYVMPGLVDAHCHVGLESDGAVPDDVAEQHALAERSAGALLLRDAGSPADTRWMDEREDLPRIIRAGRHIARPKRYLRNYADEVEPDALVTAVERQAARGDGWVKLVGDWIDREVGDLTPLWPVEVARAGIDRAHELGCRVTAHVFGEQAVAELVGGGHRRHRARHRAGRSRRSR